MGREDGRKEKRAGEGGKVGRREIGGSMVKERVCEAGKWRKEVDEGRAREKRIG